MSRMLAGAVLLLVLVLVLPLPPSAAKSVKIECSKHPAKNPYCGPGYLMDQTCGKQCQGYSAWMCMPKCTCLRCPSMDLERRLKNEKIQKQQGNNSTPAAGVGPV
ncbi:uncharacterized protein [Lolium perenne]|uniref:uncharacterized protein n=1 Tax=Lolium perenne TaxID=4522 RepID=UPI0021EA4428|nr:uncharacterized protein LOC127291823 [Lolium perenne]